MRGKRKKSKAPGEESRIEMPESTAPPEPVFGLHDASWANAQWRDLLDKIVREGMASWKDIAALVLGHLNPSQVGTSLASSEGFKRRYGKGNTMRVVMEWIYSQGGRCADCGSRLELQADHIKGREQFDDPLEADFIENMTLRCRRCNVIRRPSHKFGGTTHLTAEAALMWILLVIRPRTFRDYVRMCRLYGMTMSDIRMSEAWAMAHWLAKDRPPAYAIEADMRGRYDLLAWEDSAITRVDEGSKPPTGSIRLYNEVTGRQILGFIAQNDDGRLKFHEHPISFLPFSTYDLGPRPPQSLAIHYVPPNRKDGVGPQLLALPPRELRLVAHALREENERFQLITDSELIELSQAPTHGRIIRISGNVEGCRLDTKLCEP